MRIIDGTIDRGHLARMLDVELGRVAEVAEPLKLWVTYGCYEIEDAKKIVRRFVVVGTLEEAEAAKVAIRGPLRGDVDPRAFNTRERYEP